MNVEDTWHHAQCSLDLSMESYDFYFGSGNQGNQSGDGGLHVL